MTDMTGITAHTTSKSSDAPIAASDPARLLLPAVLLIEDDPNLGSMTSEMLAIDYRVDWVTTLAAARGSVNTEPVSLTDVVRQSVASVQGNSRR